MSDQDFETVRDELVRGCTTEAECNAPAALDALDRMVAERDRLRGALENLAEQRIGNPEWRDWDGDCCYGNYDDAHRHGIDIGWHRAADSARRAFEGSEK